MQFGPNVIFFFRLEIVHVNWQTFLISKQNLPIINFSNNKKKGGGRGHTMKNIEKVENWPCLKR